MWAIYALIAGLLYLVGNTLYVAGSFKSIRPHVEGTIQRVIGNMPGTEDMDLDEDLGLLFISSSDRRKTLHGLDSDDGIYLLSPDSSDTPKRIPTTYAGDFHPHGISFLKINSTSWLFVVNHNNAGNFVEIFEYRRDTLFHIRSIAHEIMCCPNDVVAVNQDKFYVTNDHGTRAGFKRTMEDYLRLPFSYLLYYDGREFSKAYEGLRYGNGVNTSHDGSILYLTTTTGQNLLTFDRDLQTGKLKLRNKLHLKTGLDNIDVDSQGNLWIAAHPKLLAFVGHAKDPGKHSPSQVLKLIPNAATGSYLVQEVYLDDGTNLSGSSIAVHYKNDLFVGVVFDSKLLRIKLNK